MNTALKLIIVSMLLGAGAVVNGAKYELYLFAGQSNMDGRGKTANLTESEQRPSQKTIIFYRNPPHASDGWQPLTPGFSIPPRHRSGVPSPTFGPEIGFASVMEEAHPDRRFAFVKGSKGGTSLRRDWNPDTGKIYRNFIETVRLATNSLKQKGHTFKLRGLLWHQGESDSKSSADLHYDRLVELAARLRKDLNAPRLPIVVGEVFDNGKRDTVRTALQRLSKSDPNCALVSSAGTTTWDPGTHFDARSQLLLGRRYAEAIKNLAVAEKKRAMAFPISEPIRGYAYGREIEFVEREDGLLVKAPSEYERAKAETEEYRKTTFSERLPEKYRTLDIRMPSPSTAGMFKQEDIVYATWGKRALLLDLYGPKVKSPKRLPVIIVVHGGGWGKGSHKNYRSLAINLAKRGFYTIAAEYRLSGEAPIPAAIYDLKACIRWIRANADKYSFKSDAIGITGGSAGGHLSAITAVTNEDLRFEGTANNLDQSSEVNAVLSFYGPFKWIFSKALGTRIEGRITGKDVYPDHHIRNGAKFPPLLCINEEYHRESHENWGESTVQWIKENKAGDADFFVFDAPHGYLNFSPFQEQAIDHAEKFFRRIFKQQR